MKTCSDVALGCLAALGALIVVSCAAPQRQAWESSYKGVGEDAFLTDDDFGCLTAGERVGRSYFSNSNDHLDATLAAAEAGQGAVYPVGTVVQLLPAEAMVKRHEGFSPQTGDWEFFLLDERDGQTTIVERGTTDIRNIAGTCASCHGAASAYDYVCAQRHGCDELPRFIIKKAEKAVAKDSRCQ